MARSDKRMRHLAPAETKRRREIVRRGLRKLLEASANGDTYARGVAFADMFHDPTHHKPPYAKRTMDMLVEAGVVIFSRKRYQLADGRRDELREIVNEDAKLDTIFMSGAELRAKLMEEGVSVDAYLGNEDDDYEEGDIEVVEDASEDASAVLAEAGMTDLITEDSVTPEAEAGGDPAVDFVFRFIEMEKTVATMAAQINELHQALMGTNTKAGTG